LKEGEAAAISPSVKQELTEQTLKCH